MPHGLILSVDLKLPRREHAILIEKMEDDFFLHLFSNSSVDIYPGNTTGSFQTKLAKSLQLHGRWEAALIEFCLPNTLDNVVAGQNFIELETGAKGTTRLTIASHHYDSVTGLVQDLNALLQKYYKVTHNFFALSPEKNVTISSFPINDAKKKTHRVKVPPILSLQLGFKNELTFSPFVAENLKKDSKLVGDNIPNLFLGKQNTFLVYTDFVKPQFVGNALVPLLRCISINGDNHPFGANLCRPVETPIYIPVAVHELDCPSVNIRDPAGRPASFQHGTLYCTVHFRKRH